MSAPRRRSRRLRPSRLARRTPVTTAVHPSCAAILKVRGAAREWVGWSTSCSGRSSRPSAALRSHRSLPAWWAARRSADGSARIAHPLGGLGRYPSGRAVAGFRLDLVPEPARILVDDTHLSACLQRGELSRVHVRLLAYHGGVGELEGPDAEPHSLGRRCGAAACAPASSATPLKRVRVGAPHISIFVTGGGVDFVPLVEHLDDLHDRART